MQFGKSYRQFEKAQAQKAMNSMEFKPDIKSPELIAFEQAFQILDPENTTAFSQYEDDWGGFLKNELSATMPEMLDELTTIIQNNRFVAVPSATGTGKSWLGSHLALAFYRIYEESQTYLIAAPPQSNLTTNLMAKLRSTVFRHAAMFAEDITKALSVTRKKDPDQFIQGMVIPTTGSDEERETRFSGKHKKHMLVIMDEGDAIPDFVYKAVDGWASGGVSFHLVVFFNPKRKVGELYRRIVDNKAVVYRLSAFSHPNVLTGEQVIDGAVSRAETVKRINEWCEMVPDTQLHYKSGRPIDEESGEELDLERHSDNFLLPEFLIGETTVSDSGEDFPPLEEGWYRALPEYPEFCYKVLGVYPPSPLGMTIPEKWIILARDRYDRYIKRVGNDKLPDTEPYMGFDVSDTGDDLNSACFRYDSLPVFITWKGVDAHKSPQKAAKLYHEYHAEKVMIDKSGVGAAAPGIMRDAGCTVQAILPQAGSNRRSNKVTFRIKRDEMLWAVRDWLDPDNNTGAMLPNNLRLLESLRALQHEKKNGKIEFIKNPLLYKDLGFSPDELMSLALTLTRGSTQIGSA